MSRFWGCLAISGMLLLPLRSAATTMADQQITTLLNKLQHQVIEGHSTEPANDNAMTTWLQVVVITSTLTPGQVEAINDFVHAVRSEPRQMSDQDIATLSMFANLAEAIVKGSIDKILPLPTPTTAKPTMLATPTTAKPADPPPPSKPKPLPAIVVTPRAVTVAMAQPVPPAPKPTMPAVSPQTAVYVTRGDQMMAIGDISAARKFYEYAGAEVKLAGTYDPEVLRHIGTIGLKPDLAKAMALYREAAARGDAEAKARLAALVR